MSPDTGLLYAYERSNTRPNNERTSMVRNWLHNPKIARLEHEQLVKTSGLPVIGLVGADPALTKP